MNALKSACESWDATTHSMQRTSCHALYATHITTRTLRHAVYDTQTTGSSAMMKEAIRLSCSGILARKVSPDLLSYATCSPGCKSCGKRKIQCVTEIDPRNDSMAIMHIRRPTPDAGVTNAHAQTPNSYRMRSHLFHERHLRRQ